MEKFTKKQKIVIYFIISFLIFILLYLIFSTKKDNNDTVINYAGIGGAIKKPGVYEITGINYLYELIILAGGLKKNADLSKIDTEKRIKPFAVYCIPYKKYKSQKRKKIQSSKTKFPNIPETEYKEYNIIYAGLPRTYLLITLIPKKDLVIVSHIPYYTLVPNSYYNSTLYETYLTGGVSFLINSAQRITGKKIDFYFAQNREQWIKFIDLLGGIEVNLPDDFKKDYKLETNRYKLDGLLSWEYIKYINKQLKKNEIILGTFYRMHNQKEFMKSMYNKLKENNFFKQSKTLALLLKTADTNIKSKNLIKIFFEFKNIHKIHLELLTLPGTIKKLENKEVWITQQDFYKKEIIDIITKYD